MQTPGSRIGGRGLLYQLLQQFFRIAVFRSAPQELPGQAVVLWISIAAAFLTSFGGLLFVYDFAEAIGRSVLALVVPAVMVFLLLKMRNLQNRFNQTFSAMCGSAAVIYVLVLPMMPYLFDADPETESGKWLIMLVLMIDIWALMITAHIFRHALDVGLATGVSFSILLMLVTLFLIETIAPGNLPAASSQLEVSASYAQFQAI